MRIFCILILCLFLISAPACMLPQQAPPAEPVREVTYIVQSPTQQSFINAYQEWIFLASYILSGILLGFCAKSSNKQAAQGDPKKLYKQSKQKYSLLMRMTRGLAAILAKKRK